MALQAVKDGVLPMVWEKSQSASVVHKSTEVIPFLMLLQKNKKMAPEFFCPFCPRTFSNRESGLLPHLKAHGEEGDEEDNAQFSELRLSSSKLLAYGTPFHPLHVSPVLFTSENAALNKVVLKNKQEKRRGKEKEKEEKSEENPPEEAKKRKKMQCPHCSVGFSYEKCFRKHCDNCGKQSSKKLKK